MKLLTVNIPEDINEWLQYARYGPNTDETDIFTALDCLRREDTNTSFSALVIGFSDGHLHRMEYAAELVRRAHKALSIVGIAQCARDPLKRATFLEAGGDDLLFFPVHRDEMLASLAACIRRAHGHSSSIVKFAGNDGYVNLAERRVVIKGETVHFTNHEYAIIEVLALSLGRALSREKMLQHVYRRIDYDADEQIVDVYIAKIRKKFRAHATGLEKHLETKRGHGFALVPL